MGKNSYWFNNYYMKKGGLPAFFHGLLLLNTQGYAGKGQWHGKYHTKIFCCCCQWWHTCIEMHTRQVNNKMVDLLEEGAIYSRATLNGLWAAYWWWECLIISWLKTWCSEVPEFVNQLFVVTIIDYYDLLCKAYMYKAYITALSLAIDQ